MKVLFLVSSMMSGGVERTVSYISSYFANNSIETHILSLSNEFFYNIDKKVIVNTLAVERGSKNRLFERIRRIYLRFHGVKKYLIDNCFDAVFCMSPEMIRYLFFVSSKKYNCLITSERNNPLFDSRKDIRIKNRAFMKCDAIIFQTKRAMECFDLKIQKKGIVIPNAVGNNLAYSLKTSDQRELKFSAIGRLAKQKDYDTMLKAFAKFVKEYPDFKLEIFGNGPEKEHIKDEINNLSLGSNVFLMGTDVNALMRISNSYAFIMTSQYEGMPNSLMEAMAIGLPCISSDCQFGPRELISDGINGLLFDVGDVEGCYRKMVYLAENADRASKIGKEAKAILKTNNIETISKKYYDFVVSTIGKKQNGKNTKNN